MHKIPLIKPYITEDVKNAVCEVLDSGYLTEGPVTREFESAVQDYLGCAHAIAVSNCTVGLEISLRALSVGPEDEVIVPDYTYPATASAVNIVGAKVVIVDIDPETMLIDYDAVENAISNRTKAIIPVSLFGNPLDYERLDFIKKRNDVYIIEDAACSLGAAYDGKMVGNHSDLTVFSLHPRKFVTTGEGGIITTNNKTWFKWIESYKHFGMSDAASRASTQFERIGTNSKLSNVVSAIGLVQMQHISSLLNRRRKLANRYYDLLLDVPAVRLPKTIKKGQHSWQSCCIFVPNRDEVIHKLKGKNIETQIGTYALHMHKAFSENTNCRVIGDMTGSRFAFENCLTLPLYHDMKIDEQDYVIESLRNLL